MSEPDSYQSYADAELAGTLTRLGAEKRAIAASEKVVQSEINARWLDRVQDKYAQSRKDGGTVTIKQPGGLIVKSNVSKSVEWDQDKLRSIATTMDKAAFDHYFKMSLTVPEATYKDADPEVRARLDGARTVRWGDPKITLEVKSDTA